MILSVEVLAEKGEDGIAETLRDVGGRMRPEPHTVLEYEHKALAALRVGLGEKGVALLAWL